MIIVVAVIPTSQKSDHILAELYIEYHKIIINSRLFQDSSSVLIIPGFTT